MTKKDPLCGISCYAEHLKIFLSYEGRGLSFSKKVINFDDIMIPQIKGLAKRLGFDIGDIKTLCVVRGPGRFTAIRSVYTFASVLKVLTGCRVYGIDVFSLLAYNIFKDDKNDRDIAVISHAFRDEYYFAVYRIRNGSLFEFKKPIWIYFDDLLGKLERFDGLVLYDRDEFDIDLSRLKNSKIYTADRKYMRVIPENIVECGLYFRSRVFDPIYLKPAKFEVR